MILFEKDWAKYPSATMHLSTTNKTFLRTACIYKEMGIKNHAWMLALIDKRLVDIDPNRSDLTDEVMVAVAVECYNNPWYYFREMALVPAAAGPDPIKFMANRGNMALYWLFFNEITAILVQIRQTGKSISADLINSYLINIRCRGLSAQLVTKDDTLRTKNLERMKEIESLLPFYMRHKTSKDKANTERITIKSLNNSYQGYVGNRSEKIAFNLGRGMTSSVNQLDEFGSLPCNKTILGGVLSAGGAAREQARQNNEPCGTIITMTAALKSEKEGEYAFNLAQESAVWTEQFFSAKDKAQLEIMVRGASSKKKLRVYCEFDHLQLGYTNEWLADVVDRSEASGEIADADFFNKWGESSKESALSKDDIKRIKTSSSPASYSSISTINCYIIRWYIPEKDTPAFMAEDHTLSLDSSDMGGGDDTSLTITSNSTGAIVAAATVNESSIIHMAEWILWWVSTYPKITAIIERRSTGSTIIDLVCAGLIARNINPFKRLFNIIVNDSAGNKDLLDKVMSAPMSELDYLCVKHKSKIGFSTSGSGITARSELYGTTLRQAVKNVGGVVRDRKTVNQLCAMVIRSNRVDHPIGGNDDCVTSWLLGHWFITKARNLGRYGVNTSELLSDVDSGSYSDREESDYEKAKQSMLIKELADLKKAYDREDDYMLRLRISSTIEIKKEELSSDCFNKLSISEMDESLERIKDVNRIKSSSLQDDSSAEDIYSMMYSF